MIESGAERSFPSAELGLRPTTDVNAIIRAYARQRLKAIDRGAGDAAIQVLWRAYQEARAYAAEVALTGDGKGAIEHDALPRVPLSERAMPPVLDPIMKEFAAHAERGRIDAAMAVLERASLPLSEVAATEARLFTFAIDDPLLSPALFAALAQYFGWKKEGSGLERDRPELYDRYLHRMGVAFAWFDAVREAARMGNLAGKTVRTLFLRPLPRVRLFGIGRFDVGLLENVLRDARRFVPLLGGAIDPKTLDYLQKRVNAQESVPRRLIRMLIREPMFLVPAVMLIVMGFASLVGADWLRQQMGLSLLYQKLGLSK